ncbi:TIGR00341 family protein [Hyphomonas sp.]|uniref:TIGR00341 family protein n=1 Tax=Hyphomonas sp. TaxID=87 RepID=UPI001D628B16|nr:TIGR00341 family protein [Hyphomonas sp.]MBU3919133.1 TIGR00341 family protein [Alphaproteobacteria bacterium]MBU4062794.1 TIGR00341 family protein [Alphaproteobacteria bacterium]MBU4163713.1 TIGR00341 family protein [Alphaproteobacteria bacterium]
MSSTESTRRMRPPEWRRRLKVARWRGIRQIRHNEVVEHVHEEGALSGRYIFMNIMSCGIAILGLLLSSPAVIIGAMLISPLMGPIMLMGFSLAILDLAALRQAVISLAAGTLVSLVTAFLIVFVSPLTEITTEILSRARPNFFDLLVAVFSGLAGGYAVIHRKGETIVGVAIATALMPPLAVTGYGLATAQFQIAGGAFFLFMTNLLAIALMVTVLSRFYGFGERHSPRHAAWQNALVIGVFVALSIPLGLSLRDIAYEARVRDVSRDMVLVPFNEAEARVTDFDVTFPRAGPDRIKVRATVLTPLRVPGAEALLASQLSERFRRQVAVVVDQVIIDDDLSSETARLAAVAESSFGAPMRAQTSRLEALAAERRTEREMRAAFPYELAAADIDPTARQAVFSAAPTAGVSLPAFRRLEEGLSRNFPDWGIRVDPPKTDLPAVEFAVETESMDAVRLQLASDLAWGLQRWGITEVEVVAFLPSAAAAQKFNPQSLGHRRASAVAAELTKAGIATRIVGEYRAAASKPADRAAAVLRENQILIRPLG